MWYEKQMLLLLAISIVTLPILCQSDDRNSKNFYEMEITVYFESLCPDSEHFIMQQLDFPPARVPNIHFVPFGKSASVDNGKSFVCQHGPRECEGNRYISCVFSRIPYQPELQIEFLRCFMPTYKYHSLQETAKCSEEVGVSFKETLENCYITSQGTELQLQAERETRKIPLKFVPTIVYNGLFNQTLQDESLTDFVGVYCKLQPASCYLG